MKTYDRESNLTSEGLVGPVRKHRVVLAGPKPVTFYRGYTDRLADNEVLVDGKPRKLDQSTRCDLLVV